MQSLRVMAATLSAVLVIGCGGDDGNDDPDSGGGLMDSGRSDSGRRDAGADSGLSTDAGPPVDAGLLDAGLEVDGGTVDAGIRPLDAGPPDAGPRPRDAGPPDAGPRDAGPRDAGPRDAGPPPCGAPVVPALALRNIAGTSIFAAPVFVTQAPGSTDTLWVVQRGGRIRLVRGGAILATPFLDLAGRVTPGGGAIGESGLLGLAFHPGYATNGRFFVYYTEAGTGANVVAEYRRMAGDPDRADPTEIMPRLVNQADSEANHNGGMLAFGPDGFLYVAMGDGGGGCDRHGANGNGQNLSTLLGKLLRLDVDTAPSFAAAGNPFTMPMGLPQIWALGLRNPWRFSFDRRTGDLYIGDVGQNAVEEIDFQLAGAAGGANYGWRRFEGDVALPCGATTLATMPHVPPVYVYEHDVAGRGVIHGCAVTGGYVYRGSAIPELDGVYFFGDYCRGEIGVFRMCAGVPTGAQRVAGLSVPDLSSFGQDNAGEIYVTNLGTGIVSQIVRR